MAVDYRIRGPDQIGEGVRPSSNLVRRFTDERPRVDPVRGGALAAAGAGSRQGAMAAHRGWVAHAATVLHSPRGFLLRL
jgi:hypothetical protein